MTRCLACGRVIGPKLFCWACRREIKRGEAWHHETGMVFHDRCPGEKAVEASAEPVHTEGATDHRMTEIGTSTEPVLLSLAPVPKPIGGA